MPRVFDKFHRAPVAPTGGTALELSLVKGLAEALGGQVTADNNAQGGAPLTTHLHINPTMLVPAEAGA